jgi:hypothetical protein
MLESRLAKTVQHIAPLEVRNSTSGHPETSIVLMAEA